VQNGVAINYDLWEQRGCPYLYMTAQLLILLGYLCNYGSMYRLDTLLVYFTYVDIGQTLLILKLGHPTTTV